MLGNTCANCGVSIEESDNETENTSQPSSSSEEKIAAKKSVSMLHSMPHLKVSLEAAQNIGKEDRRLLLESEKLVLLVDLDQTLVHTTNARVPKYMKDVHHFRLHSHGPWYHTKLRPNTHDFLDKMSKIYELHICTYGTRDYAEYIAKLIDPDGKLFEQRILSRNEFLNPNSKTNNLKSLFPCGDQLVCIIDDRTDVWAHAPNVVQVVPYNYFENTGDINAPPHLATKQKNRNKHTHKTKVRHRRKSNSGHGKQKQYLDENKDKLRDNGSSGKIETNKESVVDNVDTDINSTEYEDTSNSNSTDANEDKDNKEESVTNENNKEGNLIDKKSSDNVIDPDDPLPCDSKSENCTNNDNESEEDKESLEEISNNKNKEDSDNAKDENNLTESTNNKKFDPENDVVDIPDDDDYLIYLEKVLTNIHNVFYNKYKMASDMNESYLPDVKTLIPVVRKRTLANCHLIMSGMVPNGTSYRSTKAYSIAASLGATIIAELPSNKNSEEYIKITHMVAADPHTVKVRQARDIPNIKIVTPDWLWECMEKWVRINECLHPLNSKSVNTCRRTPPEHCCLPHHLKPTAAVEIHEAFFVQDNDKDCMLKEVEELLDSDISSEDNKKQSSSTKTQSFLNLMGSSSLSHDSSSEEGSSNERTKKKRRLSASQRKRRRESEISGEEEEVSKKLREESEDSESSSDDEVEELDSADEERIRKMEAELEEGE